MITEEESQQQQAEASRRAQAFFPRAMWTALGSLSPEQVEGLTSPNLRQEMIDRLERLKKFASTAINNIAEKTDEEIAETSKLISSITPEPGPSRAEQRDNSRRGFSEMLAKRQANQQQESAIMEQFQGLLLQLIIKRFFPEGLEPCQPNPISTADQTVKTEESTQETKTPPVGTSSKAPLPDSTTAPPPLQPIV